MSGGLCGFMLGTTANAMASMETIVDRYGPAPRAYLVVPMVGRVLHRLHQCASHHGVPEHMELTRDDAWALLTEYTKSDSLLKHALAVEAAVRGYAREFGEDEDGWGIVALLHDFDYERWPSLEDHPFRGSEILRERGYPEWVIRAILSHADYSGVPRDGPLEKTLFACDELAGFITAASLVRPSKSVLDLEAVLGREADEGQGVRARREARGPAGGRRAARAAARRAHRQRHRVHARAAPTRSGCQGSS